MASSPHEPAASPAPDRTEKTSVADRLSSSEGAASPVARPSDGHSAVSAALSTEVKPAASRRRAAIIGAVALCVVLGTVYLAPAVVRAFQTVSTDDAYVNGHATFVAPRVSGQVVEVLVDDNNPVRKGDVLVRLDKEPFSIQVDLKKAALEFARADFLATKDRLHGIAAQARSARFKLEHAMEEVRNEIELLKSNVAQLKLEQANLLLANQDYARGESLVTKGAVSQQQFDQYKAALEVAKNRVKSAEQTVQQTRASLGLPINTQDPLDVPADLDQKFSTVRQALAELLESAAPLGVVPSTYNGSPQQVIEEFYKLDPGGDIDRIYARLLEDAAPVKQSQAKVHQAEAELADAELNLSYCDVRAEIEGVITRRNVNPGNNVQAGQALMAIRSLTDIWIDANFKETQLAELRIGQPVDIEVDMYGSRKHFQGQISGFTMGTGSTLSLLPPQNATGNFVKVVQRLPVRIDLLNYEPSDETLFVGLSVIPYVRFKAKPEGPNAGKRLQELRPAGGSPRT